MMQTKLIPGPVALRPDYRSTIKDSERISSPTLRLGYLDALRGFAALYVVVFHISLLPRSHPEVPEWMRVFVAFGGSGVTLFFVISGFSMCLTWGRHAQTPRPALSFY